MPAISHTVTAVSEAERNRRVYTGDIVVFRGFAAVAAFVEALRARCVRYLGARRTTYQLFRRLGDQHGLGELTPSRGE